MNCRYSSENKMVARRQSCSARQRSRRCRCRHSGWLIHQRIQHQLEVEGRAADDLEHVGSALALKRFAQLAQQPRVLDGDDCLVGEVLHQRNLFVGERPRLGDRRRSRRSIVVLEHRHAESRAETAKFDGGEEVGSPSA